MIWGHDLGHDLGPDWGPDSGPDRGPALGGDAAEPVRGRLGRVTLEGDNGGKRAGRG